MSSVLWGGVLLVALWAAHWGAEQLSSPLKKLRRQWGFSVAAGGSIVAAVPGERRCFRMSSLGSGHKRFPSSVCTLLVLRKDHLRPDKMTFGLAEDSIS